MSVMASQITSLKTVYSTVYSRRRSKKTSTLRVTGLCEENSSVTGEFPAQRTSDTENVSVWWRHHVWDSHCRDKTVVRQSYLYNGNLILVSQHLYIQTCPWLINMTSVSVMMSQTTTNSSVCSTVSSTKKILELYISGPSWRETTCAPHKGRVMRNPFHGLSQHEMFTYFPLQACDFECK